MSPGVMAAQGSLEPLVEVRILRGQWSRRPFVTDGLRLCRSGCALWQGPAVRARRKSAARVLPRRWYSVLLSLPLRPQNRQGQVVLDAKCSGTSRHDPQGLRQERLTAAEGLGP